MHLCLCLVIFISITFLSRFSALKILQPFYEPLHQMCLHHLPTQSQALPELKALVCGAEFSTLQETSIYMASGLIHLFVVSGAHLILIKKFIDFLLTGLTLRHPKLSTFITWTVLLFYAAICKFNPPVTRAFFSLLVTSESIVGKNFWPSHFRTFVTGLLTLAINPDWLISLSLQLSWAVALAGAFHFDNQGMDIEDQNRKKSNPLIQSTITYLLLFPILIFFCFPNPISILLNLIFAPILEFILFPLALVVTFINGLVGGFDILIIAFKKILSLLELNLQLNQTERPNYFTLGVWVLIFSVHFVLHLQQILKERKNPCSDQ